MANSGIINGSCTGEYGKRYNFWIEWNVNSQNIAENTSNITVVCKVKRNVSWVYGYNLGKYPSTVLKIDGTQVSLTSREHIDTRDGRTSSFATWTGNVSHRSDGTLTLPIECSWTLTGVSSLTGGNALGNAAPDAIPRTTVPILSRSMSPLGETVDITLLRDDPSHTSIITWHFGGQSGDIELTSETTAEWTPPLSLASLMTEEPASDTATVVCDTYDGDVLVGSVDASVILYVPENAGTKPHLEAILSPVNNLSGDAAEHYVTGLTRVKADFGGSYGNFGAYIVSCSLTVDGITVSDPDVSELLSLPITSQDDSITVSYSVTDSRGFVSSESVSIDVIPYSPPKIVPNGSDVFAARSDSMGNVSRIGTYLKIIAATKYSPCTADGTDLNSCTLSVSYKRSDDPEWSEWIPFQNVTVSDVAQGVTLTGSDAYDVRLRALDLFGRSFYYSTSVPASTVTFHLKHGGNGAAFGKYAEENGLLDVAWRLHSMGGCTDIFDAAQNGTNRVILSDSSVGDIYDSFSCGNTVLIRCGSRVFTVTNADKTAGDIGDVFNIEAMGIEGSSIIRLKASGVSSSSDVLARAYASLSFKS